MFQEYRKRERREEKIEAIKDLLFGIFLGIIAYILVILIFSLNGGK